MDYETYLAAIRAEVARKVGWTLEQASAAVGNAVGLYERDAPLDDAVEDVLAHLFND